MYILLALITGLLVLAGVYLGNKIAVREDVMLIKKTEEESQAMVMGEEEDE